MSQASIETVVSAYQAEQPDLSACTHEDGRDNAAILRELLSALAPADVPKVRCKEERSRAIDLILAGFHREGRIVVRVAINEHLLLEHRISRSEFFALLGTDGASQ